jgi:glutathione peroxidase
VVVGFPSDDFRQEANDEAETAEVCFVNYGVTFTMLSPTAVTGRDANPVFAELARQQRAPRWNFNKYLVSPEGRVTAYFDSGTAPGSPQLDQAIAALLR